LPAGAAGPASAAWAELAARAAGEPPGSHGLSAVVVRPPGALPVVVVVPAGVPTEGEAGEEHDRDDENDAGDDADPCQRGVEPAVLVVRPDRG
jgi:hypothetical protein